MTDYENLCSAYIQLLAQDANACIYLGLNEKLGELPDPSLKKFHETRELAAELRRRADELLPDIEDFYQRLDVELVSLGARQLEVDCGLSFNGRLQAQQLPDAGDEISAGIFLLVTNDPRPAEQRLENIVTRLQQVPRYVAQAIARLDIPVARWVDIDIETCAGLPEFFASIEDWAEQEAFQLLAELKEAVSAANTALTKYCEQLRTLPTTTAFFIGTEATRELVASRGIELPLEEIHQVARNFVKRTRDEIESLRSSLAEKYELASGASTSDVQKFLASRYAFKTSGNDFSSVLQHYQETAGKIEAFVLERGLFPIPREQEMRIMQTPDFMAPMIPAGAMMAPAALREGTRISQVYLTLSEELMDEHTELGIPMMMVHEGIPGHHLQLATAAMQQSMVRRAFSANEHAEGWTTMLEDYMLDQGLMGELTDEARFLAKLDISRLGARVAIDLYFMTGDPGYLDIGYELEFASSDPFANAASLLIAATGFTPGRAEAELNWYSQERGYPLSYLVGNHLVWQLKRDYQQALSGKLSELEVDQGFHRIYLESGNMPVAMLRRVFEYEAGLVG